MLRSVMLEAQGCEYPVMIRNISATGAMFEGVREVPVGLGVQLTLNEGLVMPATVRWSRYGRTGVEFAQAVAFEGSGAIVLAAPADGADGVRRAG
jgi:hypothetical protein